MNKRTVKLVLLLAIAAAIALSGAGWKWHGPPRGGHADGTYLIAGWSWDSGSPVIVPEPQ